MSDQQICNKNPNIFFVLLSLPYSISNSIPIGTVARSMVHLKKYNYFFAPRCIRFFLIRDCYYVFENEWKKRKGIIRNANITRRELIHIEIVTKMSPLNQQTCTRSKFEKSTRGAKKGQKNTQSSRAFFHLFASGLKVNNFSLERCCRRVVKNNERKTMFQLYRNTSWITL